MMKTNEQPGRPVTLTALGAAGTVTGSKHLLRMPGLSLLIDCGLFQGLKALRERNRAPLPVDPRGIDAVILTHAHLDHCGYLPLLVKNGFTGSIFMTDPTRYLAELILRDSAKLQEEDAVKANKHGYTKHHPAQPLYTEADVNDTLVLMKTIGTGYPCKLSPEVSFSFYTAGHIPGASSVLVNCYGKTILFSGDIGRYRSNLFPPPEHPVYADFILMESTYGDRRHEKDDGGTELAFHINDCIARRGNVIIPTFAVGRAQELMLMIFELKKQKRIPPSLPVYLDSPMAMSAGKVLLRYPDWTLLKPKECRQVYESVTMNGEHSGTEKIIRKRGSKIILAGSGMVTGGRILEYLKAWIGLKSCTVILAGFQAEGTRGRALMNGAKEIKIHGKFYPVKAVVAILENLSAHADQQELIKWIGGFAPKPGSVYLVHGEPGALDALRVKVEYACGLSPKILKQDEELILFTVTEKDQPGG